MTKMKPVAVLGILILSLLWFSSLSEGKDLYKILGVDKNASQRDIQKAFHKLSLKYHPDKNKEKSAQAKFEEINNAYEILSDEEKRKNYDLFGDEKGNQGFESGHPGGADFRSGQFNFGGQNGAHFSYGPKGSQAGPQGFQFFSFPFQQGSGGGGSFSFNFGGNSMADDPFSDILSGMFGGSTGQRSANSFGNFGGPKGAYHRGSQSHGDYYQLQSLQNKDFKSRVINQGSTWLLMFYNPYTEGHKELESILQQLVPSMQALVKVGTINCQKEKNLCKVQNVMLQKMPKIFVYSIRGDGTGSLLEYVGDRNAKDIKKFCFDLLPKVSKRINPDDLDDLLKASQSLPRVLLLTTKENTPAVWRALSGLHKDKTLFYDMEVSDLSNPVARRFRIKSIPAIIGILANGDVLLLSGGTRNDQTESPKLEELNKLIESLEKENSKVRTAKRFSQTNQDRKGHVYLLTRESIDELCSEKVPLCIIGAYRSSEGKNKIQKFLKAISQRTLTRVGRKFEDVKDPLTYSILDGAKQKAFLRAFDKSSFKDADRIVIAFKPKRRTFAFHLNPASIEETERFISGALNGDVHFTKVLQSPVLS